MFNKNLRNNHFSNRGLNFSMAKYETLGKNVFVPHIRSNFQASVPNKILNNFDANSIQNPVALLQIKTNKGSFLRIKKLSKLSNSFGISLKAEKQLKNFKIKILDVKGSKDLQNRKNIENNDKIHLNSIMPKYTSKCSLPCKNFIKISPIYTFEYNSKIIAGIYLSRKDIILNKEIELNELACAGLGLYFAEGGKIAPSFTNSHPKIINTFLDFLESVAQVDRKKLSASINCSPDMSYKRKSLEEFWTYHTQIENFQEKLHIGKNVKSPCGILQINLGSKLIKELMCGMFNLIFQKYSIDYTGVIRGLLSGDGSPIQQTKHAITHHIATDKNHIEFQEKFINKIFKNKISNIKKINDGKIVLYNNWNSNINFLFLDPYKFNVFNRLKFAKQFLTSEATKIFVNIKDGNIVKGIDIAKYNMKQILSFKNLNYVNLEQITPKPNKKYEIFLTDAGKEKQKDIKNFIKNIYPIYIKDVEDFNKSLKEFNLL